MVSDQKNKKEGVLLSSVNAGADVRLLEVDAGRDFKARLAALGLLPGSSCHVVANRKFGPLVLRIKDSRVVLGRGMVDKVLVEVI